MFDTIIIQSVVSLYFYAHKVVNRILSSQQDEAIRRKEKTKSNTERRTLKKEKVKLGLKNLPEMQYEEKGGTQKKK